MRSAVDGFFGISRSGSDLKTEIVAGTTTFMTMAYILVVNPLILKDAGLDPGAVFTATALSSIAAILVMGLWARLPFALAPGMGLNAFFVYTVVLGMGHTWQFALTAVLLEGIIFLALTLLNVREAILNSIPANIKRAISAGIGLFIAFIGLANAGIVVKPQAAGLLVELGDIRHGAALVALMGLAASAVLLALNVRAALLIGILITTLIGLPLGVTSIPAGFYPVGAPPAPNLFAFEFAQVFSLDMAVVLLTFLFVDLFDTVGTLVGVATRAGMLDENGRLPRARQALFADAVGTTVGACLGTSTVTTYVESAAGVAAGGRTGLTALVAGGWFFLALFLAPVFSLVPAAATAPALILVGLFMLSPALALDLDDMTEALPAFLTLILMPLTYSIAEGIAFGLIAYALLKLFTGRWRDAHPLVWVLSALFVAKYFA